MTSGKKIGITTVLYNSSRHIQIFLESLIANADSIERVVFVDNNSTDAIEKDLSALDGHVHYLLIKNATNVGYAHAINIGIRKFLESDTDYILVTNNDLRIKKGGLEILLNDLIDAHADVAGVPTTHNGHAYKLGNRYDQELDQIVSDAAYSISDLERLMQEKKYTETLYVQGGIILFSRSFFETTGLYDEYLFFGGDESDFTLRIIFSKHKPRAIISLRSYDRFDHFTHHDDRFKMLKARMIMRGETYVLMKHGYGIGSRQFWEKVKKLYRELGKTSPIRYIFLTLFLVIAIIRNSMYLRTTRQASVL